MSCAVLCSYLIGILNYMYNSASKILQLTLNKNIQCDDISSKTSCPDLTTRLMFSQINEISMRNGWHIICDILQKGVLARILSNNITFLLQLTSVYGQEWPPHAARLTCRKTLYMHLENVKYNCISDICRREHTCGKLDTDQLIE